MTMCYIKSMSLRTNGHPTGSYRGVCCLKSDRLEVFLPPLDEMLVHRRVTPALKLPVLIYTLG